MAQGMIFHTRSNDSFACKASPLSKLLLLLTVCTVLAIAPVPLVYALTLALIATALAQRLPLATCLTQGMLFLILALFIAVTEYIVTQSMIMAIAEALRFLSAILASLLFVDATSPDELAASLAWLFRPILGRKAYLIASVVQLTLSMIPLVFDTALLMKEARKARGQNMLHHPVMALSGYALGLISTLIDKVEEWSDALTARSYTPYASRGGVSFGWRDVIITIAALALAGGQLLWTRMF